MDTTTQTADRPEWKPEAGRRAWDRAFESHVDIMRVYAATATVQVWGRGLSADRRLTFRGVNLARLSAPREIARNGRGEIIRNANGEMVFVTP